MLSTAQRSTAAPESPGVGIQARFGPRVLQMSGLEANIAIVSYS